MWKTIKRIISGPTTSDVEEMCYNNQIITQKIHTLIDRYFERVLQ